MMCVPPLMRDCSKPVTSLRKISVCSGVQNPITRFDHGAVVPGAVEEADLARIGQVRAIALEVPLARFILGRLRKGRRARAARIEVLGEAADRAALAGRVTAFKSTMIFEFVRLTQS